MELSLHALIKDNITSPMLIHQCIWSFVGSVCIARNERRFSSSERVEYRHNQQGKAFTPTQAGLINFHSLCFIVTRVYKLKWRLKGKDATQKNSKKLRS